MPTQPPSGTAALTPGVLGTQRWKRLLPIVFVTYSLAYLDRSNYSLAVAGGMKDDLHITGGVSAFIGAAFFLGYFAFQVPGALYAERRSVKNLIFWSLIAWGVLASMQGLLTNVTALIVVRFLVGVVEAAVLPAMVIFLSHWFTKGERGRANTFLILGNPVTVLWLQRRLRLPDRADLVARDVRHRGHPGRDLGLRLPRDGRRPAARRRVARPGRSATPSSRRSPPSRPPSRRSATGAPRCARATSCCCPSSTCCGASASTASSSGCPRSSKPDPARASVSPA